MIEYILLGLVLGVATVYIIKRIKKQMTVGDGNHQCDDCSLN